MGDLSREIPIEQIKLSAAIEEKGKDRYATPAEDVRVYVHKAISELGLDNEIINDTDSAMYAWRLVYGENNVAIALEVLDIDKQSSLSEIARAMADAPKDKIGQIESNEGYELPPLITG